MKTSPVPVQAPLPGSSSGLGAGPGARSTRARGGRAQRGISPRIAQPATGGEAQHPSPTRTSRPMPLRYRVLRGVRLRHRIFSELSSPPAPAPSLRFALRCLRPSRAVSTRGDGRWFLSLSHRQPRARWCARRSRSGGPVSSPLRRAVGTTSSIGNIQKTLPPSDETHSPPRSAAWQPITLVIERYRDAASDGPRRSSHASRQGCRRRFAASD